MATGFAFRGVDRFAFRGVDGYAYRGVGGVAAVFLVRPSSDEIRGGKPLLWGRR